MIKFAAFLVGFCFSVLVFGAETSFSIYGVTLSDLARVVLDDVAGASVITSPEVIEDRSTVNFVLKKSNAQAAVDTLERLVQSRGYSLSKSNGVYYLERAKAPDADLLVYLPRFRSANYLTDLVGGIIPRSAIMNQRLVGGQVVPQSAAHGASSINSVETGTNVNSLLDKSDKDALVIKGSSVELAMVRKMLDQVDRPVPEMLIKAVVLEVQTGKIESSAVSLLANLLSSNVSASWKGGTSTDNNITIKLGGLEAVWSAISSDTRFKILSAPQVRVKSGSSARFAVGSETPVLGAVNYHGNGQSVQSVEYKPSGVILELRPEIRGELAELKVFQQLSSFAKTETGVNNSPTLLKRELSTSVVVSQNDVVLLGGLDEEKSLNSNSGFFFLPSWARSNSADVGRSEIVLMLYVERVLTPGEVI